MTYSYIATNSYGDPSLPSPALVWIPDFRVITGRTPKYMGYK